MNYNVSHQLDQQADGTKTFRRIAMQPVPDVVFRYNHPIKEVTVVERRTIGVGGTVEVFEPHSVNNV